MKNDGKKARGRVRLKTGRASHVRVRWFVIPFLVAVLGLAGTQLLLGAQNCPSIEEFRAYTPPEATRVFASDGALLADLSPDRRVVVALDDVPAEVRDGFVAVEDRRFLEHAGVDLRGVVRAAWRDLKSLSLDEGFSTITMQLARNVFTEELPRGEKVRRKLCEVKLSREIEDAYSKDEILGRYLNQVYMGDGLYGVEEAARGYFGKAVSDVTLPQTALLIGLVKNPEGYNPRKNEVRAIQRRNVVLAVMAREGVISAQQAETAQAAALDLAPPREASASAPY
ncbi:MAG: transglycosylase domain-containing protein, partial [Longimicrobiales bacterium]